MRLITAALFVSLLAAPAISRADTVLSYQITNGSLNDYTGNVSSPTGANVGTVSGTFSFDTTTDKFTAVDLTYVYNPNPGAQPAQTFTFTSAGPITFGMYMGSTYYYTILGASTKSMGDSAPGDAYLELNTSYQICTLSNLCPGTNASNLVIGQGNVPNIGSLATTTTLSTTPEPSSLLLLGTGICGMAGVVRRKIKRD